jgi:hypothetical protein
MKLTRLLPLFLAFIGTVNSGRAQTLDYTSLVSFWSLNGSAVDNANTNNGTFVGNPAYGPGPITNTVAASLDGSSFINVGTNIVFDASTPFSATAWINGPAGQESDVISKMVDGGNYTGWELHIGTTAGGSGPGLPNVWLIQVFGSSYIQVNCPTNVLDNTWHHLAFTYDGSGQAAGVRIFVDGQDDTGDVASDNLAGSFANSVDLDIGCRQDGANHIFQGEIGQVSVWSTNLSATEISSIYTNGIHPPVLISSLLVDDPNPYAGQTVTLSWQADPGATLSFDQGIGDVTSLTTNGVGSVQVVAETTTAYSLTATKTGHPTQTRSIGVTIKPLITSFGATRNTVPLGLSTTLLWSINPFTTNVSLAPAPGDVSQLTTNGLGAFSFMPSNPATYTLTVARNGLTNQSSVALLVAPASAYASTVMNTPGLVGYWRFDAPSTTDSWVNGFTGTNENDAAIGPSGSGCPLASETSNQGLVLPGNGGYLASDLFGEVTNQFTLMAWINMPSYPGTGTNDGYFEIVDQQTFADDCDLITFPDGTIHFYTDQGGNIATPNPIPINEWHFIVGTSISGGPRRIYLDGQLAGENVAGPHTVAPNSPFWVGYSPVFTPRHYVGSIDEAAFFDRAISGYEVAAIYWASGPTNLGTAQSITLQLTAEGPVGAQLPSSVTVNYSSGAKFDVTGAASFTSSDTNVVTVGAGGLVTALHPGTATVTASYQGLNASNAVTVLPQPVPSGYATVLMNTPGLIGYWRFDSPLLHDSWINSFTGTLQNDATSGAPGSGCPLASDPTNQALVLPGNGGYLTTDLFGGLTNEFTLMAWVNIASYPGAGNNDGYYEIMDEQAFGSDCDLIVFPDGSIQFYTDTGGNVGTTNPIPMNEWHFIVGTMTNSGPRRIYVDGQLQSENVAGRHTSAPYTPLWIGNGPLFGPRHFVGALDEAAVFNRALSQSEVAAIYSAASATNFPGPIRLATPSFTPPSTFTFSWNSAAGVSYAIESSTNLVNWVSVQTNYPTGGATGSVTSYTNAAATGARLYYRVR